MCWIDGDGSPPPTGSSRQDRTIDSLAVRGRRSVGNAFVRLCIPLIQASMRRPFAPALSLATGQMLLARTRSRPEARAQSATTGKELSRCALLPRLCRRIAIRFERTLRFHGRNQTIHRRSVLAATSLVDGPRS